MNRRLACLTVCHIAAVAILNLGDLIRVCALIAIPVIAAWADPVSTWKIDAPASGLAVIASHCRSSSTTSCGYSPPQWSPSYG
ncbi:hypothetical protein [Streptomyces sp. ALI-76-A]|uniref:hypothetical protein n=1 Tax=Streptomyces sp. ALI-76-A TaxID=3025736 RepID=UPI00256EA0A4|nr:hypothetical protein [Streptomyces sp. ALI-76-A]MDL5199663.1 hypothetical protein [Streptomyces sp. ALI-76-A]